jgi:hypothetical protein
MPACLSDGTEKYGDVGHVIGFGRFLNKIF